MGAPVGHPVEANSVLYLSTRIENAMPETGYHLDVREGSRTYSAGWACSRVGPRQRSQIMKLYGFTLLEITLAVAVLGMMSLAIFRFVQSNLTALRVSA